MVQVTAGVLFELMRFCVVIRNYIFETFYIELRGIIQNNKNIEYFAQSSKFQHLRITFLRKCKTIFAWFIVGLYRREKMYKYCETDAKNVVGLHHLKLAKNPL